MTMPPDSATERTSSARSDWHPPRPAMLSRPTYWPAVLAFGLTATAFGIVTTIAISGIGLLVCAVAIGGWIAELRHEH